MSHLLTMADAVATHARLTPDKLAVHDSRRRLTFAQWDRRASQLGSALLGLGLAKGDRVGVIAYNCLEWMEIYAGMARAGLVVVPLNFRLTGPEMAYILGHADVAAVIAGPEFCATVDSVRAELALPAGRHLVLADDAPAGWVSFDALMASAPADPVFDRVRPEDMCALMYTSGTTGRPKGAIRNHGGNTLIALATALEMGFTRDDTALLVMPLCHANSLYFGSTFIHLGATCVIDDRRSFDPEALLRTLAEDRVTFTSLVPTHYIMLLALPEEVKRRHDLSAVGKLMISSAPARQDTKRGIMELFPNGKLYELYGSTETGWVTLLRPQEQLRKLGSVGREWAGSGAIRLLDEQRREVPDGEVGELFSRTAYVFDGYWLSPEKTAEAMDGEWCSVGDMARRDEEGFIWLVDRKSNMIISGGENVYPSEVEGVLGQHPKVCDVAVIGVPHEKWGETAKAVVVLHQGEETSEAELRDWCRQRLAGFKCPTEVVFINEPDMPRTATGKILHRVLRQRYVTA
ncbi:class I adenylate-forming enzyme family protein [Hydrogenophaga sp.]|uniref:class I adenylate-forming enzyme family protein n=1 Tax=Hydrogenophaga sp. TaxID=1904254 RepID=UPI0027307FE5|nr:AMP-binding protein [Hydrogenophaga sp.]MDP2016973.1 AMP-binding protein [Hydrogenophaga sp.]MDP3811175.1 AMP-binding protein [Hydrogenophaga sp.]